MVREWESWPLRHARIPLVAGWRRRLDGDFDIVAKQSQKVHEAFGREAAKLAAQEVGALRLVDFQ